MVIKAHLKSPFLQLLKRTRNRHDNDLIRSATLGGRSLTTYVDKTRQVGGILEMSTVGRFPLTKVKELLHQCQLGVGRWSIIGKIWSTQLKNGPLGKGVNIKSLKSHQKIHTAQKVQGFYVASPCESFIHLGAG